MIKTEDFTKWLSLLLAETFGLSDAPSGFFLDTGRSGLFGTINAISAETASTALKPENATIASHCAHVLFLLRLFEAYEQGQRLEPDWPESWKTRVVDEVAWRTLRAELQTAYDTVLARLRARTAWEEPPLAASMILLAHCAYHVGEIRQLLTSTTP
jgi:hypothetical protein